MNTAAVEPVSQRRYSPSVETIGTRIEIILARTGWTQRELGRRAGIAESSPSGLIAKFKKDPHANYEHKTLAGIARAAGVSLRWLERGEGAPGWDEHTDAPSPPDEPQAAPDVALHDRPPATFGMMAGYAALERAARKLAADLDEWVWQYLRVSNPLLDSRYPITPASLATLARAIAQHAQPPANTTK